MDDGLVRAGPAEFFAGEALDGAGVVLHGVDGSAQLAVEFGLLDNLGLDFKKLVAETLVLLDQREVAKKDREQKKGEDCEP